MASARSRHLRLIPLGPPPIILDERRRRSRNQLVQRASRVGAGAAIGLALPRIAEGEIARLLLAVAFFACLALTVLLSAALGGSVYEWALRKRVDRAATALRAELRG